MAKEKSASTEAKEERKLQTSLIAFSNLNSPNFIDPRSAVSEPLSKLGGSMYSVPGITGKGEEGKIPLVYGKNYFDYLENSGKIIKISAQVSTIKSAFFPHPIDEMSGYHLFYDTRNDKAPVAAFLVHKEKVKENGREFMRTKSMDTLPLSEAITIIPREVENDELMSTTAIILGSLRSEKLEMIGGFNEALANENLYGKLSTGRDIVRFIELYDQYLIRHDENMNTIKASRDMAANASTGGKVVEMKVFEKQGGLSERYSYVNITGASVQSLKSVRAIKDLIRGEYDERIASGDQSPEIQLLAAQKTHFEQTKSSENTKGFDISIRNREETITGYDSAGNLVVIENAGVTLKSNGEVYEELSSQKAFSVINAAASVIRNAYFGDQKSADYPSGDAIDTAVAKLKGEALALIPKVYKESNEDTIKKIGLMVEKYASSQGIEKGTDSSEGFEAWRRLSALESFCRKATMRLYVQDPNRGMVKDGFLTRGKERIRGINYSFSEPEGYARSKKITNFDSYLIATQIPTLTFPVGSDMIRFKSVTAPVAKVFRSREDGKVLDLLRGANISSHNDQGHFGRVINAILDLNEKNEDYAKTKKNLMNYGSSYNNEATNFGLAGAKVKNPELGKRLGGFINDIYIALEKDDLAGAKKIITDTFASKDEDLRNVGLYIQSVKRNSEANRYLSKLYYGSANSKTKEAIIEGINTPEDFAISGKFTAAETMTIKTSILTVRSQLDEHDRAAEKMNDLYDPVTYKKRATQEEVTVSAIENAASQLGFSIVSTNSLKLLRKQNNGIVIDGSSTITPRGEYNVAFEWNSEKQEYDINEGKLKDQFERLENSSLAERIREPMEEVMSEYKESRSSGYDPAINAANAISSESEAQLASFNINIADLVSVKEVSAEQLPDEGIPSIDVSKEDGGTPGAEPAEDLFAAALKGGTGAEEEELVTKDVENTVGIDEIDFDADEILLDENEHSDIGVASAAKTVEKATAHINKKSFPTVG